MIRLRMLFFGSISNVSVTLLLLRHNERLDSSRGRDMHHEDYLCIGIYDIYDYSIGITFPAILAILAIGTIFAVGTVLAVGTIFTILAIFTISLDVGVCPCYSTIKGNLPCTVILADTYHRQHDVI